MRRCLCSCLAAWAWRHLTAFLRAAAAGFGALFAVFHVVLRTLRFARLA
jgi:hypothetical protein